ncbi:DUF3320 domain-containing protein [Rhodopirellula sp. JC639]|uniref:DUF3320 domain-containing protein n=1 Tax=Stieleria mannarensis TaxID=2755585 RepID=UPI001602FA39|nr:DUF3320 domain-containing protein [Rhodopirellula sp. JC639]
MDLAAVIEKTRRDLLELTARNRLVHTPLDGKRKSWVQVHDERTDNVFDLLVRQGKTMSFLPVTPEVDEDDREQFLREFEETNDDQLDDDAECSGDGGEVPERYTDLFLQTTFSQDALNDRLLKLYYEARTAEEEQGVSILYLACGFLKWRESGSSAVDRYAPLLLIPVELSRNSVRSKFRVNFRDDEIVTNLSIQARLQQDFGLRLPDLPEGIQDEPQWTPTAYFDDIRKLIEGREGWQVLDNEILLWFFSFTKFLMFRDLSPAAWPEGSGLTENGLIAGLLGDAFPSGSALPPICGDDEPIDQMVNPANVVHVTDADSSQAVVIEEIVRGRNLVVQGPPGTGKSQTITNAIAAAVHAGKRVLFVAEKMAALDVVKRRLDAVGLGPMSLELHSHKARKSEVLEDLKATMNLGAPTAANHVPIDELRQTAQRLRHHDVTLHGQVGESGCSPFQAMGSLLNLRQQGRPAPAYRVAELSQWTPETYQRCRHVAKELDQLLLASGTPASNPWRGARCKPMTPANVERLLGTMKTVQAAIEKLDAANVALAEILELPAAKNIKETAGLAQLAAYVRQCPAMVDREAIRHASWQTEIPRLEALIGEVRALQDSRRSLDGRISDTAWNLDWSATRVALAGHGKSWFRIFNSSFRGALAMLRGVCISDLPKDADQRVGLVDNILALQKSAQEIDAEDAMCRSVFGSVWSGADSPVEDLDAIVGWVKEGQKSKLLTQHGRRLAGDAAKAPAMAEPLNRIAKLLKTVDGELSKIASVLQIDFPKAFNTSDARTTSLADWLARMDEWQGAAEQLSHYLATMARVTTLREAGLRELAGEIESGALAAGDVAAQLELIRSDAILADAWSDRRDLAEFHGDTYEKLRSRFAQLDTDRIAQSRVDVAKKHHENLPARSADGGQVSVVMRETNKKRRHMPIRRLIKEAGHAIQKIKPVFMMSPLSVAQYLEPGAVEFDLLVIDEASQVQPVDALGAIARSKQIVVVGDQRQLPPTDFFGRMSDDKPDDDDDAVTNASDLESILGLCEAQGLPSRMLSWHYRSRHESLIAVSNRQFYDDRLFIVPSPVLSGGELGLKLRYIADGCYDRGGSRANRNEAIAVAEAVIQHARQRPHLSLGVATFSAAQRDAIRNEIELRRKEDASVEEFFNSGGAEPFFVKSLENVQGDQRDVIFISIGYGKDKDGYFAHSFGPLNRKGGERRLNVLISRAASACEVFTSLKADDIDLAHTQSEGVAALKMFLNYAEHGRLDATQSHGGADSIFEEQVAKALRNRGLEVDHQIGVGGFFIDLAIRDPERRGRYLLGIECDGAQYHSARWVRDRDRIRQQVLEARGWIIHRIWSTDWFQRPEEQIEKTLDALEDAKRHWKQKDAEDSDGAGRSVAPPTTPNATEHPPICREELPEATTARELKGEDYRETRMPNQHFDGGPAELSDAVLTGLARQIIEIESPIHLDEIGRRMIRICGQGRLVSSLKSRIADSVNALQEAGMVDQRDAFVYTAGQQQFPVRYRKHLDNAKLRNVDFIPPEELRGAIFAVVEHQIGTHEDQTASSVAKLLGISNSKSLQAHVREQIKRLVEMHALENRDGSLFVASGSAIPSGV